MKVVKFVVRVWQDHVIYLILMYLEWNGHITVPSFTLLFFNIYLRTTEICSYLFETPVHSLECLRAEEVFEGPAVV